MAGKKLSVDTNVIKRKFYAASNCILGNAKCVDDIVKLNLMETFCLPILLYSIVAFDLNTCQTDELNACWNSAYRRIFGFHKWESVRQFIWGLGRLDFKSIKCLLC